MKSIFFKDDRLPFVEARFVLNSNFHYAKHFHDTLSIGAIEKGEVSYRHNDKDYLLKPNALAIINPYELHSCNPFKNQARTYHMTYIDTHWCKQIQESIFGKLDKFLPLLYMNIDDKKLYKEYINLNRTLLDKKYLYIEKEELLYKFLLNLFVKYPSLDKQTNKDYTNYEILVEKSKKFMGQNFSENITIKDISEHLQISEFHFIRVFKQTTHMTPHAYLLNLKVIEAKRLLNLGEDISQVALKVGFFDQSHLNRVFKSQVATTPYLYKKDLA